MITTTFVDAFTGTRLRGGYVAPSAQPSGKHFWRQSPPVVLGGLHDREQQHRCVRSGVSP